MMPGHRAGIDGWPITDQARKHIEQLPHHIQKLQIMAGEVGPAGKPAGAVRRHDIDSSLQGTKGKLKSKQLSAAPTQTDYNNLQSDVALIFAMLTQLRETITK